jgi:hypothetical protein
VGLPASLPVSRPASFCSSFSPIRNSFSGVLEARTTKAITTFGTTSWRLNAPRIRLLCLNH